MEKRWSCDECIVFDRHYSSLSGAGLLCKVARSGSVHVGTSGSGGISC